MVLWSVSVDQSCQDLAIAFNGLGTGRPIGTGNSGALAGSQFPLKINARIREGKHAAPAVISARALGDESLGYELAQNTRETLLGDPQDREKFAHRDTRVTTDEIHDAMVSTPKTMGYERRIGFCRDITKRAE